MGSRRLPEHLLRGQMRFEFTISLIASHESSWPHVKGAVAQGSQHQSKSYITMKTQISIGAQRSFLRIFCPLQTSRALRLQFWQEDVIVDDLIIYTCITTSVHSMTSRRVHLDFTISLLFKCRGLVPSNWRCLIWYPSLYSIKSTLISVRPSGIVKRNPSKLSSTGDGSYSTQNGTFQG